MKFQLFQQFDDTLVCFKNNRNKKNKSIKRGSK